VILSLASDHTFVSLQDAPTTITIVPEGKVAVWLWRAAWSSAGEFETATDFEIGGATYMALSSTSERAQVSLQGQSPPLEVTLAPIESPESLLELGFEATTPAAQKALEVFAGSIAGDVEQTSLFALLAPPSEQAEAEVFTKSGLAFHSVVRIPKLETLGPSCVATREFKPTYYGQDAAPETPPEADGHCGNMGVVRSMIQLGVKGDWKKKGGKLNGDKIRDIDQKEKNPGQKGMTNDQVAAAHKRLLSAAGRSKPNCDISPDFDLTNPKITLKHFVTDLNKYVDDDWDCGISYSGTMLTVPQAGNPKPVPFAHHEHVTKVAVDKHGNASVETADGFSQGNGNLNDIDAAGETNYYNIKQAENDGTAITPPNFGWSYSADKHINGTMMGSKLTSISYVCCK
jgi:hypothetical protein